ncbi:MAG: hypothetical protein QOC96_1271 [Acidobacteriota bacterium]|jgi:hypothetical protein|nr:hypothetical protein [Acidobacteriota bacterium]
MKGIVKKASLILVCLVISASARLDYARYIQPKPPKEDQHVARVSFCELTKHPELYTNKLVKTSAIFVDYFPDVWFMYDQNCSDENSRVIDYLNCKADAECQRLRNLASWKDGDGEKWRNRMVVIGEIQIVNRQNRSGENIRVLKFAVSDIESVSRVPSNVPWP